MLKKKRKNLKSLEDFQKLNKTELIDELMMSTIKGGCCSGTGDDYTYAEGNDPKNSLPIDVFPDMDLEQ